MPTPVEKLHQGRVIHPGLERFNASSDGSAYEQKLREGYAARLAKARKPETIFQRIASLSKTALTRVRLLLQLR